MATTKISTGVLKDGSVTSAKLDTNISIVGDLTVDTNTLFVDSASNRVGIGTSSPSTLLTADLGTSGNIAHFEGNSNVALRIGESAGDMYLNSNNGNAAIAFQTNTVERMRIDSAGNVGIGVSSTAAKLQVKTNTNGDGIIIQRSSGTEGAYGQLGFSLTTNDVGNANVWIRGSRGSSFGENFMTFGTGGSTGNERMRIDSSGNVGIGTTAPKSKLDVAGASSHTAINSGDSDIVPFLAAVSYVTGALTNWADAVNGFGLFYRTTEGNFQLDRKNGSTTANQVLTIKRTDGNVGIGTSSPDAKFSVNGTIKSTTSDYASPSTGGAISVFQDNNNYASIWAVKNYNQGWADVTLCRLGGNVGIGTSSPSALLTLARSDNFPFIHWNNSSGANMAFAGYHISNGDFRIGTSPSLPLVFQTNLTERMRITSAGGINLSQGTNNTYVGTDAGNLGTSTGTNNSALGVDALRFNTTGTINTAIGTNALRNNTTGSNNTANGVGALFYNTIGTANVANGVDALRNNTTGGSNTANGRDSLYNNTTGSSNTANGDRALYLNTTGGFNTANGRESLYSNTTASNNTATGFRALYLNTTGGNNTANGLNALYNNTTGIDNTANGVNALLSNTTGGQNTANGKDALRYNTTTSSNTATGWRALYLNTTGGNNTANGTSALQNNTTGSNNTATGLNALRDNTTGSGNVANGYQALHSNTTASNNTATGWRALYLNTTGTSNAANGVQALYNNTTGNNNTANGYVSLGNNTTGGGNIAIGYNSGTALTTGSNNTIIGSVAGTAGMADTVIIAAGTTERLRVLSNGDLHCDGDVVAYSTTISDERLKDDIQTIDNALDKVCNLRGVSYTWNNGSRKGQNDLGLIAQEVEQVLPELVREKEMPMIDGGTYKTVDYEKIVGVLIEAIKELTEKVNKLEAK